MQRPTHSTCTWAAMSAALLMIVCAAGCGRNSADGRVVLRLAHVYEPAAPTHRCGAKLLAERINAADVGLEIRVFPASQLGNETELIEQLATGQLEMSIAGPSFLATWHEAIGAFDAAFAFEDFEHLVEVADGPIGQRLWKELREKHRVRVLGTWFYGLRHVTSKDKPIRTPDDLKGFRLRLPDARVWQETGRALGANPMPVPFAEVYLALQQGIADGQENPIPTIQAMGFHEVQQYLNLTGHIYASTQALIAESVWQRLTDEQRQVLEQTVRELADDMHQCVEEDERRILAQWQESGALKVVADVDRDLFQARAEQHFSQGHSFSELYREIRAMRGSQQMIGQSQ